MASNVVEGNHYLFNCQVCLEEMTKKQPRLLQCGHSFCSSCLEQLLRHDGFKCPTCRFKVNETDINKIPVNFSLMKMKEIELDMMKVALQTNLCKFCLAKGKKVKAKVTCTDCDRNMCEDCSSYHATLAAFENHRVVNLFCQTSKDICDRHGQNIKFFCTECLIALCVDCTFEEKHSTHASQIKDMCDGLKETKRKMQTFYENVEQIWQSFPTDCIDVTRKVKSQITNRLKEVQKQAQEEYDDLMKQIPSEDQLATLYKALGKARTDLSKLLKMQGYNYIDSLARVHADVTLSLGPARQYYRYLHQISFENSTTGPSVLIGTLNTDCKPDGVFFSKTCKKPTLLLDVECLSFNINQPSEIDLTENFIVISDHSNLAVKMFSLDGYFLQEFEMDGAFGHVNAVAAFGKELYVAQRHGITRLLHDHVKLERKVYKPNVQSVSCIAIVESMLVLIVDCFSGTLSKFDCKSQKTKQICSGLHTPNSVTYAHKMCVVVDYGTNTVKMYDSSFRPICVVGGDYNFIPRGAVILPSGNLLVSVNKTHSIHEYDQTGKLIQSVLTENDGIKYPCNIRYKNGKFVLLERSGGHHVVKLFSV